MRHTCVKNTYHLRVYLSLLVVIIAMAKQDPPAHLHLHAKIICKQLSDWLLKRKLSKMNQWVLSYQKSTLPVKMAAIVWVDN